MSSTDPFSVIHDAIWAQLEAHAPFAATVKAGNRIKDQHRPRQNVMPNDSPRVGVFPSPGGGADLFNTSSSSRFVQNFTVSMATVKTTPQAALFPLKWEIVRAIAKAEDKLGLPALVTKVRITDASETDAADPDTPTVLWSGLIVVSVEFRVANTTLTGD